jgi:hypothetical protein
MQAALFCYLREVCESYGLIFASRHPRTENYSLCIEGGTMSASVGGYFD